MKERADKELDRLVERVMKDAAVESTSFNFTDVVMSQIEGSSARNVVIYKPLISKTAWSFILIGFLMMVFYVIFNSKAESSIWPNGLDFSLIDLKWKGYFIGSSFSKTTVYAMVFLGLMICLQVSFLKHYFNRRLEH